MCHGSGREAASLATGRPDRADRPNGGAPSLRRHYVEQAATNVWANQDLTLVKGKRKVPALASSVSVLGTGSPALILRARSSDSALSRVICSTHLGSSEAHAPVAWPAGGRSAPPFYGASTRRSPHAAPRTPPPSPKATHSSPRCTPQTPAGGEDPALSRGVAARHGKGETHPINREAAPDRRASAKAAGHPRALVARSPSRRQLCKRKRSPAGLSCP